MFTQQQQQQQKRRINKQQIFGFYRMQRIVVGWKIDDKSFRNKIIYIFLANTCEQWNLSVHFLRCVIKHTEKKRFISNKLK